MAHPDRLTNTHTSVVTPSQIDHLGHMNVRYYALNARGATVTLLDRLGWSDPERVDVFDMYTRHHREQLVDTRLQVRSGVLGVDAESIRLYHELSNEESGELAATFVYRIRADTPIDHVDVVDLPSQGAARSIDIESAPAQPSLDTVRQLGLEVRAPRQVDTDDTGGTRTVTAHMLPMLVWGGTPARGSEHRLVLTGPDGENVGWATMETRIVVNRLPSLGTWIQSFGATTAMADKTTSMSMWAFDLDSGEVLMSFEVVNLLFNIDGRRAMSIPDEMREEYRANFHPELGARRG